MKQTDMIVNFNDDTAPDFGKTTELTVTKSQH